MAIHGDLSSFPVPELLQWMDGSRKTGTLLLSWEAGERKLFVQAGQLVGTASAGLHERIARVLSMSGLAKGERVMAAFAAMRVSQEPTEAFFKEDLDPNFARHLAQEELFGVMADLTFADRGHFHWSEDIDRSGEEWAPLDLSVRELVFEALRWLDEQPEVERALPSDAMVIRPLVKQNEEMPLIQRVVLSLCGEELTLGRLRLEMGISRFAAARRVFDLLRCKYASVDGAPKVEADPIAQMLQTGAHLVREQQFDAAGMIFTSLLSSDPADRRVQEFARMVEREHAASLYEALPPIFVPSLGEDPAPLADLRPEERQVASLVNGVWDVATIVLASPTRELETLKTLHKLNRLGLLLKVNSEQRESGAA